MIFVYTQNLTLSLLECVLNITIISIYFDYYIYMNLLKCAQNYTSSQVITVNLVDNPSNQHLYEQPVYQKNN